MGRLLDHVKQFVEAELGTEGSVDGNNRLVLRYVTLITKIIHGPVVKASTLITRTHQPCSRAREEPQPRLCILTLSHLACPVCLG